MTNIYVEGKGPQGPRIKESLLPAAVSGYERGLAVVYASEDETGVALASVAGGPILGLLEEDAVSTINPCAIIEIGQAVAQIGANVAAQQPLATNAAGLLVPAQPGQNVVAISLENQSYVAPGSLACVLVLGAAGGVMPGAQVNYLTATGAIPVVSGTYALNGAGALAMALAAPTAAQDGTVIRVVALTAHAHTVKTPADGIYGTKDTVTFAAVGDTVELEAVNTIWMVNEIGGPTPASLSEV